MTHTDLSVPVETTGTTVPRAAGVAAFQRLKAAFFAISLRRSGVIRWARALFGWRFFRLLNLSLPLRYRRSAFRAGLDRGGEGGVWSS